MEYLHRIPDKTQIRNAINQFKIIFTLFVYLSFLGRLYRLLWLMRKRTFLFHVRKPICNYINA